MALSARGMLFSRLCPMIQPKRFRGKINIQRPKPVHFERAVFMGLTEPWYLNPKRDKKQIELCSKSNDRVVEEVQNKLQEIIARGIRERFFNSKLIAVYHVNPFPAEKRFKAYVMFKKANMHFKPVYGKKTVGTAVKDTQFEPILELFMSQTTMVFSPEPDVRQLLKITKKFPQLVLLAAVYEGKFISRDQLMALESVPNLQTAQAGLVQVLNSAAATLHQQLNSHQNTLVAQLQERMKQLELEK